MKCYPIVIPTLNRFQHFKNCVESLSKCKYAEQTELVIGLDYPLKKSHIDGYNRIKVYLQTIQGFGKITVFERDKNFGAAKNLQDLIQYVFQSNSAVILTEDDNIFAPTFLEFVNSALEVFEANNNITSICGYTSERHYSSNADYLLSPDTSAWGVARWKNKDFFNTHDRNGYACSVLKSLRQSFRIFMTYPACLAMLMEMVKKGEIYGDTLWTTYNILDNKYQVKPTTSLVRNMGQDGSGLHSGSNDKSFSNQKLSQRTEYIITLSSDFRKINFSELFFYSLSKNRLKALCSVIKIGVKYCIFRLHSKGL